KMRIYISKISIAVIAFIVITATFAFAQSRVAVLPFENKDGKLSLNVIAYKLQDSLTKSLIAKDPEEKYYRVVPIDSIEALLAQFNLDPTNPQYASDVWKAVKQLHIKYVLLGNFNVNSGNFLINAYIFNVHTKIAVPRYQAKDIFKTEEKVMESIPEIIESIIGFWIK
ncbi:MAG: hypothetical protein WCT77_11895, partial [Bacteroidota bacterium]